MVGKLGAGGMGVVYKAVQLSMDRMVALKVVPVQSVIDDEAQSMERFLREGRAAGKICHPHVVTCYDAGRSGDTLYMAMELVAGGDAEKEMEKSGGRLAERRMLEITLHAARGLQAIYEAGLIHRDIKPSNILLTDKGVAKIADLGLAKNANGDDRMTVSGGTVGTPSFMSPEQANGVSDIDVRTDIYSLGATMFAMLTGQKPYRANTPWAVVAKIIAGPFPDPRTYLPQISPLTAEIILKACAKERDQRFATPALMAEAVQHALDRLVPQVVPVVSDQPGVPMTMTEKAGPPTKKTWIYPTVLISVGLVSVAIWFLMPAAPAVMEMGAPAGDALAKEAVKAIGPRNDAWHDRTELTQEERLLLPAWEGVWETKFDDSEWGTRQFRVDTQLFRLECTDKLPNHTFSWYVDMGVPDDPIVSNLGPKGEDGVRRYEVDIRFIRGFYRPFLLRGRELILNGGIMTLENGVIRYDTRIWTRVPAMAK
jgi:hypothetical protein